MTYKDNGPDPIDVHVGSRVRLRRREINMSQTEVGQVIGITFQQLQKQERAKNRFSASALYKVATALGVPVGYFFEGLK